MASPRESAQFSQAAVVFAKSREKWLLSARFEQAELLRSHKKAANRPREAKAVVPPTEISDQLGCSLVRTRLGVRLFGNDMRPGRQLPRNFHAGVHKPRAKARGRH
jgi:hypothetical protein